MAEELATASVYHNVLYNKSVSAIKFYTKQILPQYVRIQKPKETTFKLRYENHKKSFNHRNCKSDIELSNEFWKIKDKKRSTNITWEILRRHQVYNTSSKRRSLCLNEKLKIALHRNNNILYRQAEILNKCRHKNKYVLVSHDSKD